jgi:hypothetical protein
MELAADSYNPPLPSTDSSLRAKHDNNDQRGLLNNASSSIIATWIRTLNKTGGNALVMMIQEVTTTCSPAGSAGGSDGAQ